MTTISVKYIGHKALKDDNVADSGLVWRGHGDVQKVSDAQWAKLSRHPDIWERVDGDAQPLTLSAITPAGISPVAQAVVAGIQPASMTPESSMPAVDQPASVALDTPTVAVQVPPAQTQALLGSDVLDSIIDIGGTPVQLGTIVAAAHDVSGLSVDDWNGLVPQIREQLLSDQIAAMRAQAAAVNANTGEQPGEQGAGEQGNEGGQDAAAVKTTRARRAATPPAGEVS